MLSVLALLGGCTDPYDVYVAAARIPESKVIRLRVAVCDQFGDERTPEAVRFEVEPALGKSDWETIPGVFVTEGTIFEGFECTIPDRAGSTIRLVVRFRMYRGGWGCQSVETDIWW